MILLFSQQKKRHLCSFITSFNRWPLGPLFTPQWPHTLSVQVYNLPLGLLAVKESLEDGKQLFQSGQPGSHLLQDFLLVLTELDVEVLSVGAGTHSGAEDGLHHEGVVGFEGCAVGVSEGGGELFAGGCDVLGEGDGCEVKGTVRNIKVSTLF